jgi:hypothetical protein
MTDATEWAEAIAVVVAPDERELTATGVQAYIGGGSARRDLMRTSSDGGGVSAFGPGEAMVMPAIYHALAANVDAVVPYLLGAIPTVSGAVGILTGALSLRARYDDHQREQAMKETIAADPKLDAIAAAVEASLRSRGMPDTESQQIARGVVETLLLDPARAAEFVQQLAKKK